MDGSGDRAFGRTRVNHPEQGDRGLPLLLSTYQGTLRREDKRYNRQLAKERIWIEHVNGRLKGFRILAERYRNRRRRFGLRCNLIAAIDNLE